MLLLESKKDHGGACWLADSWLDEDRTRERPELCKGVGTARKMLYFRKDEALVSGSGLLSDNDHQLRKDQ